MFEEYQERIYREVKSVLPNQDSDVSLDDLKSMPFLDRFIKETLRLFPAVPVLTRRVTKDILVGIPSYTVV